MEPSSFFLHLVSACTVPYMECSPLCIVCAVCMYVLRTTESELNPAARALPLRIADAPASCCLGQPLAQNSSSLVAVAARGSLADDRHYRSTRPTAAAEPRICLASPSSRRRSFVFGAGTLHPVPYPLSPEFHGWHTRSGNMSSTHVTTLGPDPGGFHGLKLDI